MWKCANCRTENPDDMSTCSVCGKMKGANVTVEASGRKKDNCFAAVGTTAKSFTANVLLVVAALVWIVGVICAVLTIVQSFVLALAVAAGFGLAGLMCMCMAELFQNVANIAASLQSLTITQTEYRE